MLKDVLDLVARRGTTRIGELARMLDASPEAVLQALDGLVRLGYLEAVAPGRGTPCDHCPLSAACMYRRRPRVLRLTRKGEAWLARKQPEKEPR